MIQLLIFIIGLILFLSGIHMMSHALEQLTLKRMHWVLNMMTDKRWKAILSGVIMTAILHSSSTLTILIIALVGSGHMKFKNACWIVMGANVGTTFSSALFFIDISSYVYVLCLLGIFISLNSKYIGRTIIGLSMLLFGLNVMSTSLLPLQNDRIFMSVFHYIDNPLVLVLLGIVICGVIQSSSACMAILLSFSKNGLIPFCQGAFLLYGFDIGTCLDTSLASLTSNKEGRKVAMFHLLFNISGTLIFTFISLSTPFLKYYENMLNVNVSVLFTVLHMTFNIMTLFAFLFIDKKVIGLIDSYIN